jgi:hypothetical protein
MHLPLQLEPHRCGRKDPQNTLRISGEHSGACPLCSIKGRHFQSSVSCTRICVQLSVHSPTAQSERTAECLPSSCSLAIQTAVKASKTSTRPSWCPTHTRASIATMLKTFPACVCKLCRHSPPLVQTRRITAAVHKVPSGVSAAAAIAELCARFFPGAFSSRSERYPPGVMKRTLPAALIVHTPPPSDGTRHVTAVLCILTVPEPPPMGEASSDARLHGVPLGVKAQTVPSSCPVKTAPLRDIAMQRTDDRSTSGRHLYSFLASTSRPRDRAAMSHGRDPEAELNGSADPIKYWRSSNRPYMYPSDKIAGSRIVQGGWKCVVLCAPRRSSNCSN